MKHATGRIAAWCLAIAFACLPLQGMAGNHEQSAQSTMRAAGLDAGNNHACAVRANGEVACWGNNSAGQIATQQFTAFAVATGDQQSCALRSNGFATCWGRVDVAPATGPFIALAAGGGDVCALRPDGRIACWGGSLSESAPTDADFVSVDVGVNHACAVRADGSLSCWRAIGTPTLGAVPAGRFLSVAVGRSHACAVGSDGVVSCWGANGSGQATVPSGQRFTEVSVGNAHTCGLLGDGTVTCWGDNAASQRGAPTGHFTRITSAEDHTCARAVDGTAHCWGGAFGPTGYQPSHYGYQKISVGNGLACGTVYEGDFGCAGDEDSPLMPAARKYLDLAIGGAWACGLGLDGKPVCWGSDAPQPPQESLTRIQVGSTHACGLRSDGSVACWGANDRGQATPPSDGGFDTLALGDGVSCAMGSERGLACWGTGPVVSAAPQGTFRELSVHGDKACVIDFGYVMRCWGNVGTLAPPGGTYFEYVAVGEQHVCGVVAYPSRTLRCWGDDSQQQLQAPSGSNYYRIAAHGAMTCAAMSASNGVRMRCWGARSADVRGPSLRFGLGAIAAGDQHSCTLKPFGGVSCWGDASRGQAAAPTARYRALDAYGDHACVGKANGTLGCWGDDTHGGSTPVTEVVRGLGVGQFNGCAVGADGAARCWGWNDNDQGNAPGDKFRTVATGLNHSCGLRDDGTLACWGYDADGQAMPPAGAFREVDVGERHSCAIAMNGTPVCWGLGSESQTTPPALSGATYRTLAVGAFHACGILSNGPLVCWGRNDRGQATPPTEGTYVAVTAGFAHSCAIRSDGARLCWGDNTSGQAPVLSILPASPLRMRVAEPVSIDFTMTGTGGYVAPSPVFRLSSGQMPYDLRLNENGQLRGQPSGTPGLYTFTLVARDENGLSVSRDYQITLDRAFDTTPPEVVPVYNNNTQYRPEWFNTDVHLRWQVTDHESPVTSQTGCETITVTSDTEGTAYTCTAVSEGGTTTVTAIVRRDTVAPQTSFDGPQTSVFYAPPWYQSVDLVFTFVAEDQGGSGFAGFECTFGLDSTWYESCNSPFYRGLGASDNGPAFHFRVRARDHAGNVDPTPALHEFHTRIDRTRPVVTPQIAGTLGDNGWYISDVQLRWQVEDPETAITFREGCVDRDINFDTKAFMSTCRARSLPGETEIFVGIMRDATPPTVQALTDAIANAAGWHRHNVSVRYTCMDATSGIAGVCPASETISQEGRDVSSVPRTVRDTAGLTGTSGVITVNLDKTPPSMQAAVSPQPNAAGWHRSDATVSYACADALSGLAAGACPAARVVTQEGRAQSITASVSDQADNVASATQSISLDRTPPTITASPANSPNVYGWYRSDVQVYFGCSDSLSGLAGSCPATQVLSQEGSAVSSASHVVQDIAGNTSAPNNVVTVKIDKTAPTLSVTMPPAQIVFRATHDFALSANDALSGMASMGCTGFTTATLGTRTATCSATDRAGNVTTRTSTYTVVKPRITGGPQRPEQRPVPVQRPVSGRPVPGASRPSRPSGR